MRIKMIKKIMTARGKRVLGRVLAIEAQAIVKLASLFFEVLNR
jgi:hypothetical protein